MKEAAYTVCTHGYMDTYMVLAEQVDEAIWGFNLQVCKCYHYHSQRANIKARTSRGGTSFRLPVDVDTTCISEELPARNAGGANRGRASGSTAPGIAEQSLGRAVTCHTCVTSTDTMYGTWVHRYFEYLGTCPGG